MLKIQKVTAKGEGYTVYLSRDGTGKENEGMYQGSLLEHDFFANLHPQVTLGTLKSLCEGYFEGHKLCYRKSESRIQGYDFLQTVDKSVSIGLSCCYPEQTVREVFFKANEKTLPLIEQLVKPNRNKSYDEAGQVKILSAGFVHYWNRHNEPHIHSHNFVFNFGIGEDRKAVALETRSCFKNKELIEQAFQHNLHLSMKSVGINSEMQNGKVIIPSVRKELCESLSSGKNIIDRVLPQVMEKQYTIHSVPALRNVINDKKRPPKSEPLMSAGDLISQEDRSAILSYTVIEPKEIAQQRETFLNYRHNYSFEKAKENENYYSGLVSWKGKLSANSRRIEPKKPEYLRDRFTTKTIRERNEDGSLGWHTFHLNRFDLKERKRREKFLKHCQDKRIGMEQTDSIRFWRQRHRDKEVFSRVQRNSRIRERTM
jgi:conjugative relaxase-like TrwC/TraI family protein